ncbi:hypothetical protein OH807_03585 [Kitasatospora sp. NBC_01560]|uniref:DUF2231 domain-containing protein n=1 Tax=Kitasatospora sp. NBC_01560 TaxID=2975965 RepID=UPI0038677687
MDLTTFNGVPVHVLLVHAVVVLVPLTALAVVACALRPPLLRRFGLGLPLLALVSLGSVPLTTNAGEWLAEHVRESTLVERHAELGDGLLPWAVGLFVLAAALGWAAWRPDRSPAVLSAAAGQSAGRTAGRSRAAVMALAVILAVGAVVQVYRIGDSGAQATWQGVTTANTTENERPRG